MNTNILGDFQICNSVSLRTPFSIEHPWLLLLKWLFSGVFKQQHVGNGWIPSYVRKKEKSCKRKVGRLMFAESSMGKRSSHMMKGSQTIICRQNRTRTYSLSSCFLYFFYLPVLRQA